MNFHFQIFKFLINFKNNNQNQLFSQTDQTEMAGSTILRRGNFDDRFRILYQLEISQRHVKFSPCPYINILLKMCKAKSSFDIGNSSKHAMDYQNIKKGPPGTQTIKTFYLFCELKFMLFTKSILCSYS